MLLCADVHLQVIREFSRKPTSLCFVQVEGVDVLNGENPAQRKQLDAALVSAPAHGHYFRFRSSKMFGGDCCCRACADNGDLDGIHHCQGISVRSVTEDNQALNVWHREALLVGEEISIQLCGEIGA